MLTRKIRRLVRGRRTEGGAGVCVTRVGGGGSGGDFDPFLALDVIDSTDPDSYVRGFPSHPHRGIEIVTYLIEGEIEHGDGPGAQGVLRGGDCLWTTAGSGVVHSEMPKRAPRFLGLQFWLNLPRRDKTTPPKSYGATADRIPNVAAEGGAVRVLSGSYNGIQGAIQSDHARATFLDVELRPRASWRVDTPRGMTAFLYVIEGCGTFTEADEIVIQKNAILFTDGDRIAVRAGGVGARFILCMAMPLMN